MTNPSTTLERAPATTCHREESDRYDRILLQISADWRIIECRDAIQFILQRRGGARWTATAFHRTSATLPEACRRRGAFLSTNQVEAIGRFPEICGVA